MHVPVVPSGVDVFLSSGLPTANQQQPNHHNTTPHNQLLSESHLHWPVTVNHIPVHCYGERPCPPLPAA